MRPNHMWQGNDRTVAVFEKRQQILILRLTYSLTEITTHVTQGRKIEVNDANVHVQQKKPKRANVMPMVVDGTTHYAMPVLYQPPGTD